ncbi:hypothetical protein LP420_22480 [Massilia sp. B-10]|nr:hypothetical protein LP420_22480 [Massilia sp. B-10]
MLADAREWYEAVSNFHDQRLKAQLKDGAMIVKEAAPTTAALVVEKLLRLSEALGGRAWMDVYRDFGKHEPQFKVTLDESKELPMTCSSRSATAYLIETRKSSSGWLSI